MPRAKRGGRRARHDGEMFTFTLDHVARDHELEHTLNAIAIMQWHGDQVMPARLIDPHRFDIAGYDRARPVRVLVGRQASIPANIDLQGLAVRLHDEESDDERAVVLQIEYDAIRRLRERV